MIKIKGKIYWTNTEAEEEKKKLQARKIWTGLKK